MNTLLDSRHTPSLRSAKSASNSFTKLGIITVKVRKINLEQQGLILKSQNLYYTLPQVVHTRRASVQCVASRSSMWRTTNRQVYSKGLYVYVMYVSVTLLISSLLKKFVHAPTTKLICIRFRVSDRYDTTFIVWQYSYIPHYSLHTTIKTRKEREKNEC